MVDHCSQPPVLDLFSHLNDAALNPGRRHSALADKMRWPSAASGTHAYVMAALRPDPFHLVVGLRPRPLEETRC